MSLADELLADLEDLDNDISDTEDVKIKEEPNDEDEVDHSAADENEMEIDESVGIFFLLNKISKFIQQQIQLEILKVTFFFDFFVWK